jgi:hypothetical protein
MRKSALFGLILLVGCATSKSPLIFNIRSADVASASAETLDTSHSSDDFNGQIHILFNEHGGKRFRHFMKSNAGRLFELQVNGETLLQEVGASPAGGKEAWFFTASIEDARQFATSLNNK